ncbi:hypothetical protein ACH5RR_032064 [Cinchona calisaya]|uniref:Uncharacterized protein n=1 Tax=Cinchona calisaya TaxID=153742 RepID=A0ABD2YH15_9GENT
MYSDSELMNDHIMARAYANIVKAKNETAKSFSFQELQRKSNPIGGATSETELKAKQKVLYGRSAWNLFSTILLSFLICFGFNMLHVDGN